MTDLKKVEISTILKPILKLRQYKNKLLILIICVEILQKMKIGSILGHICRNLAILSLKSQNFKLIGGKILKNGEFQLLMPGLKL